MFLLFSGRDGRPCAHWCYWGEESQTAPSRTTIIKWKRGKRIKREINFKYFLTFQFPVLPSVLPPAGCESSNCESIGARHWGSWIPGNYIGIHFSMRIRLSCHSYLFEVKCFSPGTERVSMESQSQSWSDPCRARACRQSLPRHQVLQVLQEFSQRIRKLRIVTDHLQRWEVHNFLLSVGYEYSGSLGGDDIFIRKDLNTPDKYRWREKQWTQSWF